MIVEILVVISHHLHLSIGDYDWPDEDLEAYHRTVSRYNVVAVFNGHTHGTPPRRNRWSGKKVSGDGPGIDNFDPDDAGASKIGREGKPVGLGHGLLYVELIDRPGDDRDEFIVRAYTTRDNWKNARWETVWKKSVKMPPRRQRF